MKDDAPGGTRWRCTGGCGRNYHDDPAKTHATFKRGPGDLDDKLIEFTCDDCLALSNLLPDQTGQKDFMTSVRRLRQLEPEQRTLLDSLVRLGASTDTLKTILRRKKP
jgi:hypothetical protein